MFTEFQGLLPVITVLGSVGGLAWWLSTQLNAIKELVYSQIEKTSVKIDSMENNLLEKLEYHERHDDKRFEGISDSLWELRLRNAAVDNTLKLNKTVVKLEEKL